MFYNCGLCIYCTFGLLNLFFGSSGSLETPRRRSEGSLVRKFRVSTLAKEGDGARVIYACMVMGGSYGIHDRGTHSLPSYLKPITNISDDNIYHLLYWHI